MTRTLIPEGLVGGIALGMFLWLWPTVYSIQYLIYTTEKTNTALQLSSAMAVLIMGLYLLIGAYCGGACFERFAYLIYKGYKKWRLSQRRDWL